MFAGCGVEAGICQSKPLDRLALDDVGLHDLVDICFGDPAVPNCLGIDHHVGAMLALVETPGLVRAHSAFQSTFGEFLLEEFLQASFGCWIAASPGMPRRALVSTDEDVLFEFWHQRPPEQISTTILTRKASRFLEWCN